MINSGNDLGEINFKRILVIRLDEIGDLCYSLQAFEALRNRYPDAEITLWCKPFAIGLVHDHPAFNHIVTRRDDLRGNYDLIVDLRGKWEGFKYTLSHLPVGRVDRGTVRLRNKRKGSHPHESVTNFEVISPLLKGGASIPAPQLYPSLNDQAAAREFIRDNALQRFAVIHPGARRELRRWPVSRFAEVAALLHDSYGLDIVLTGDLSEKNLLEELTAAIPFRTYSTCGVLSLGGFAALMKQASFFIGNESGPLHIAALSGTPSLGLFGPGEPRVFYPPGKKADILHHILPCNPCDQVHCVHPENPCIRRITISEVHEKITALISSAIPQG